MGTGGGGTGGVGGDQGGEGGKAPVILYPDLATLFDLGISRTCSLNSGGCHKARAFPELGAITDLPSLVAMPCQLGAQAPSATLDECEVPGDRLQIGDIDHEILYVNVSDFEPFPPTRARLRLAGAPSTLLDPNARIRRVDEGGTEVLSISLSGVVLEPGPTPLFVDLDLSAAVDPGLSDFMDPRAWHGERVRMGDPNNNGIAHATSLRWAEVVPGDPSRSFLYQRLIQDTYGPRMPLIQRTWSDEATRALWCWIRALPANATPTSIDVKAPIDYASCPPDPSLPDPTGGWEAVRTIMGNQCATAQCHSSQIKAGNLDLTPDATSFQQNVLNAASSQAMGAMLVVPGQPLASYLFCKVDPSCSGRAATTEQMPLGKPTLSSAELQAISDWIVQGAMVK